MKKTIIIVAIFITIGIGYSHQEQHAVTVRNIEVPVRVFADNQFVDNLTQVVVSGGKTANRNEWNGNYWSDYEGFDLDENGVGDAPYDLYAYADRLWKDVPNAQFFKGSPMLEVMDFLERLAPFSEPNLLVQDKNPAKEQFVQMARVEKEEEMDAFSLLQQSLSD